MGLEQVRDTHPLVYKHFSLLDDGQSILSKSLK